jgi:ribonuclease BN (tRNA processing enzyme)
VLDLQFYERVGVPPPLLEHFKRAHTLTTEVGSIAQRAGVHTLVLSHLVPSNPALYSDAQYRRKCQRGFDGRVIVGNDLDRIRLRAAASTP